MTPVWASGSSPHSGKRRFSAPVRGSRQDLQVCSWVKGHRRGEESSRRLLLAGLGPKLLALQSGELGKMRGS